MKTTGKLGKYSWVIEAGWTTLYIGDPSEEKTIIDEFGTCDPEEAILTAITNDTAKLARDIAKEAAKAEFHEVLEDLMEYEGDCNVTDDLITKIQRKHKKRNR